MACAIAACAALALPFAAGADAGLARDLLAKGRLLAAHDELLESAEKGDAVSQRVLGMLLERGARVERGAELPARPEEAAGWYAKAAAQGDKRAAGYLGALHAIGLGVPHDSVEAMALYRKAGIGEKVVRQHFAGKLYNEQRDCFAWVLAVRVYTEREIRYPVEARRGEGMQGSVEMRVFVDDRRVERVKNTAGELLGDEAMRAAYRAMLLAPPPPAVQGKGCNGTSVIDFKLLD